MPVAVSVVVATYNTGEALDAMVESIRRQSIGTDRLELVLVDDGSTDGTGERVEALAREHPWVVARRIPNSGWPSRPRNEGFAAAGGEFVMVMDHDDALFPEALARMVAAGQRDGADLVIGKEVRSAGRTQGLDTFRRNVTRADVVADDILELHTPHRMWRRAFLQEHGLRFSETLRRLEDHQIIAETLVHAPVVTVVADYACYHWIIHGDNNSLRLPDPVEYYAALREVLDSVDRWPYAETVKDAGRLMWLRTTVLDRFGPSGLRTWPAEYQRPFFEQARAVTLERFPPDLDPRLPASHRVRAALLRAGDLDGLLAYMEGDRHVSTRPEVVGVTEEPDLLRLRVETRLEGEHGAVVFRELGDGRVLQDPSGPLPAQVAERTLDVTHDLAAGRVDLVATHRGTNAEWFLPTTSTVRVRRRTDGDAGGDDGFELVIAAEGVLAPATAQLGAPLEPGIWDIRLRTVLLGYDSRPPLRIDAEELPGALPFGTLLAQPYVTRGGRLAVKVTERPIPPVPDASSVRSGDAARGAKARRVLGRIGRRLGQ